MADLEGLKVAKDYHVNVPFANQNGFFVKGANSLDWGMKKHLTNIFNPKSGNTVMLAFDHGYFMGSTAGLERLDLLVPKLAPYVDVLMGTRGAIRTCVAPEITKSVVLRVSAGSSMIQDDLSHEVVAMDIDDCIRMNADAMAVQTFIGADGQLESLRGHRGSSSWLPALWLRWEFRWLRRMTAKTLMKLSLHARFRLLWQAERRFRKKMPCIWLTM